jgi:hypothetical protein
MDQGRPPIRHGVKYYGKPETDYEAQAMAEKAQQAGDTGQQDR